MSKGKAIVDNALQHNNKEVQPESAKTSSSARRVARDPDRQPTLIHWFLENPVLRPDAGPLEITSEPVTPDLGTASTPPTQGQAVEVPAKAAPAENVDGAQAKTADTDVRFARLEAEKQELESLLCELRAEKQQVSEYRSSVLLGKDREIKQLRRQLADLESQVLRLNRVLDQKDREAQVVAGSLRDRDAFLSALKRTGFFRRAFGWGQCFSPPR